MAKNPITVLKEAEAGLNQVNTGLMTVINNILKVNQAASNAPKNFFNVQAPKQLNTTLEQRGKITLQLNGYLKEKVALEKALIRQTNKVTLAERGVSDALVKQRTEMQLLNQKSKEAAILSSKLSSEYQKQSVKLTQLRRKYKDIALTQGENTKAAKRLRLEITKLDSRLKRVDAGVGQFQRSVGNYGRAMRGAVGAARSLAGALGFTGGLYLAVRVFKDAFNRIREFDKAMQNIAGIMRTTRGSIKDLEEEIISVAASSIKTSREVASLAENLVTLGKTKSEIKDLLEPVNNLAIGLEVTSGEAAEFLVQTLNAFGASSNEAEKYADIIATIRTSTTLNFQKMRDSFQYLTPISRILNKDLAYTGAVIGILADNGLKAEQSGRLLGTAQQKLAKQGRSLSDALTLVNEAQARGVKEVELLKLASDLFGKQAAKVGIILAQNSDEIEINSQKIRENTGALDDLTNEQLKSLDAQLKILDSTWEQFILTIENGEGSIGDFFKSSITFAIRYLQELTKIEKAQGDVFKITGAQKGFLDYLKQLNPFTSLIGSNYEDLIELQKDFNKANKNLDSNGLNVLTTMHNRLSEAIKNNKDLSEEEKKLYQNQLILVDESINKKKEERKSLESTAIALGFNVKELGNYSDSINDYTNNDLQKFIDANKDSTDSFDENTGAIIRNVAFLRKQIQLNKAKLELSTTREEAKAIQDKIKLLEKERDAILGSSKKREDAKKIIKGSVAEYKKLISELEDERDRLATSGKEYGEYNKKIDAAKEKVERLTKALEAVNELSANKPFELPTDNKDLLKKLKIHEDSKAYEILIEKQKAEVIQAIREGTLDHAKNLTAEQIAVVENAINLQTKLQQDFEEVKKDLVFSGIESIFDTRIANVDKEIDENNRYYAAILDNESLSEEQRDGIEAERDRKNLELDKKKKKREKAAFLAKKGLAVAEIAINLAKTISAITLTAHELNSISFGVAGTAYAATNIPIAIGTAAAQTGIIIAQAIPAFEKGKNERDNYQGAAIWGEKRQEVKISKDGSVELSPDKIGNHLTHVKKDDIILPDASKYLSNLSNNELYENIHKHTILSNMSNQTEALNAYAIAKSFDNSMDKHSKKMIKAFKENRPKINLQNNNSIGRDLNFLGRLNDTL